MKKIIKLSIYMIVGLTLNNNDINFTQLSYWVIMLSVLIMDVYSFKDGLDNSI